MAHHRITRGDMTLVLTDMCFRCGREQAGPQDVEPGDAFQCLHCAGWLEVLARSSADDSTFCIWFSPFDRKATPDALPAPGI